MVKFCCVFVALLVTSSQAFPAPQPENFAEMQHPAQLHQNAEDEMMMESNLYGFNPDIEVGVHERQRRQLGFGGMGGGMGGAQAQAQAQSQSLGAGMGLGGMGMGGFPYMMGMPFIG